MTIEIPCQQFSDLKLVVDGPPVSQDDIAGLVIRAEEISTSCIKRSSGTNCPGHCAIPRIMRGNPREIRKALEEASE